MKNTLKSTLIIFSLLACTTILADNTVTTSVTKSDVDSDQNGSSQTSTTVTTTKQNDTDARLVSDVYNKYSKDAALIGTSISVSSQNGVVTLTGTVTGQSQADQAVISAKSVPGVRDVRSSINVITNPGSNSQVKSTLNY